MTPAQSDLIAALRASKPEGGSGEHPAPEALAAYFESRLSSDDEERVQLHLVACRDCSALVLELEELASSTPASPPDLASAAAWREQRRRLFGSDSGTGAREARSRGGWARGGWAVAAALALVTVGLGLWSASLRGTISELRAPQVDPPIANLEPVGSIREADREPTVTVAPGATHWLLILNLIDDTSRRSYRLEIIGADDAVVARLDGLVQSPEGGFRLLLPRAYVPPGAYRARLSGDGSAGEDGISERIADYRFRIEAP